jgi:hypothetical protein
MALAEIARGAIAASISARSPLTPFRKQKRHQHEAGGGDEENDPANDVRGGGHGGIRDGRGR